jgi:hypothetical protein
MLKKNSGNIKALSFIIQENNFAAIGIIARGRDNIVFNPQGGR